MVWVIAVLILLIPLLSVVLDSELGRALAARVKGAEPLDRPLASRLAALEAEVDRLSREVQQLQDESEFLRRLLEGRPAGSALPSGERDR